MSANEYIPIRVSTLRGDLKIPFDAYVKVASKHILFCRQGDSFEGDRLVRLKKKKLKKMYILPEHEEPYRRYISESIEAAFDNNSDKSIEDRAAVIQGAQQAAAEDVMENPEDQHSYHLAKKGSAKYVEFILNNSEATKSILAIKNADNDLAHHGVTVSTLALGIAKELGVVESQPQLLDQLILGSLLHDFDHYHSGIPYSLPLQEMTDEQRVIYLAHPQSGVDRLKNLQHFDQLVLKIILQHEELINGSGFPNKMLEKDLDPLVLTVSTANAFDRYITFQNVPVKDALKTMLIEKMGLYPLAQMKALQLALKNQGVITS